MPIKELNIFHRHGKQFVPDLRKAILPEIFRGRPVITGKITLTEGKMVSSLCPVGAIALTPATHCEDCCQCSIDLGKCVFCKECEFALPGKIRFTNDYKIATNIRERLIVSPDTDQLISLDTEKVRKEIPSFFKQALKLRQVSAAGDNSAEMELNAAGNVNFDMGRYGIEFVASPRHADGIVITGPISQNMAEALQICYEAVPSPKLVILAGTDAISGGIFNDCDSLNREFLSNHPVDLYIPGNPPHPLTFINGVLDLLGRK